MKYALILFSALLIWSCNNAPKAGPTDGLEKLLKDYEMQPNADRAKAYLDSLGTYVPTILTQKEKVLPFLKKGIDVSIAQGMLASSPAYLLPLLRNYPDLSDRQDYLVKLGDVLYALRKRHASDIVFKELLAIAPNNELIASKKQLIDPKALENEDYLTYLFDQLTVDPDKTGINKAAALRYVDAVEAMALVVPGNESVPRHLYGAAEVARSLRTFPKAMSLYDWILESYPNSDKAPNVLFIKGFILEQDYNRDEEAKAVYQQFLKQYPNHQMAESAQFLLDNLGKSDEEMLREIESRKKNQS